jgi:YidC/Oxa1 family membrane protein insertase
MDTEKRLLLAVFLAFLVLYGYQVLVVQPATTRAREKAAAAAAAAPPQAATEAPGARAGTAPGQPAPGQPAGQPAAGAASMSAPAPAAPLVAEQAERDIVVDTKTVRAVFTNRGARLKSWQLKSYLNLQKSPQELVATYLPADRALPFDLRLDDAAASATLKTALFQASATGAIDVARGPETLVFDYKDASGLSARKEFTFEPGGYVVRVSVDVQAGGRSLNPTVLWGLGLGDQIPGADASRYSQKPEAILVRGDKVQRIAATDLDKQPVQEGEVTAAGVDTHYFIALAMPARMLRVEYWRAVLPAPAGVDPKKGTELVGFGVRQAQSMSNVKFFVGPKDFDVLETVDRKLVRVINFGIFDFLVVPLLRALEWIHAYVGNYGWAIIILTFIINALMFPLRHKSMVSMRKMQDLQPEMKAIQERYGKLKATDPEKQKMNAEVMNLYKQRGVNPAAGCIPMLLTMPVLFAFYSLLSQAIEIRGEPFIWWIKDLSAHDPYYVTPILMGASQFWQQKLTPTSPDPQMVMQQKMMMLMPLVFTFMFLWMPSGLTVYWFFSNLLAIGQQYLTNALVGPPNAPRSPAERRMKKAEGKA